MERLSSASVMPLLAAGFLLVSGCTPLTEYVKNGFKVGPNFQSPPAPVTSNWIDAANPRVKSTPADLSAWWTVFNDPRYDVQGADPLARPDGGSAPHRAIAASRSVGG